MKGQEEEMMRKTLVLVVMCLLLSSITAFASAEEELFDTKAAAVYLEKGLAQLRAKNVNAAIEDLEESVSINPDAEAYYYLGYAYYLKGRSGDAASRKKSIDNFDKAYELDPNFSPNRHKPAEIPGAQLEQKTPDSPAPEKTMSGTAQPPEGKEATQAGQ